MFSFLKGRSTYRWGVLGALLVSLLVSPSARGLEQVIVRPNVPTPVVAINVPTSSPTFDAGTSTSIAVSGTVTSQTTITSCSWTNNLGGSGAAPIGIGNNNWSITSIALTVGTNVVTVSCTDLSAQVGIDIISITRQLPAIPIVTINVPTSSPTFDAGTSSTVTVSGTSSSSAAITGCTWINSLGGSGAATGTTAWSVISLPLIVGSNVVTITCTDSFAQPGNDVITITRSAASGANPISGVRMPASSTTLPNPTFAAAGVESGIPARTSPAANCATLGTAGQVASFVQSVTVAQINSAISSCPANQVVFLNRGTYNLSTGITFHTNSVTLRGAGADSTKLVFSGDVSGCNYFVSAGISMCTGDQFYGDPNADGSVVQADVQTTWTPLGASGSWVAAGGTTQLTMASTSGLAVGLSIVLDQLDDTSDGYPAVGDLFACGTSGCSSQGGGGQAARNGRAQTQIVKVTNISGSTVTIDPPLILPNWRQTKTPGAYWNTSANASWLHDSGVEDLSIDFTGGGVGTSGIAMHATFDCWVKGVRVITRENTGGGNVFQIMMIYGFHNTVRDNYFYGPLATGIQRYGNTLINVSSSLFENNIFHHVVGGYIPNGPVIGNVFSYSYERDAIYSTGGTTLHGLTEMNLHEGNRMSNLRGDVIHAPHFFEIAFRNLYDDNTSNPSASRNMPGNLETYSRFWSFVGNVMGGTGASAYEQVCASESCGDFGGPYSNVIYELGWGGNNTGTNMPDDGRVAATLLRWYNYDTVTGTTRCQSSEVPTGITNYSNTLPGACSAPTSLYLSARPPFVPGARPWPLTGPDVTGGDVAGFGGHANKIPAQVCYESLATDGVYATDIKVFNAGSCYP